MKKLNLLFVLFVSSICLSGNIFGQLTVYAPDVPIVAGDQFYVSISALCPKEGGLYEWDRTAFQAISFDCPKTGILEKATFRVIKYGNYTSKINVKLLDRNSKELGNGSCTVTVVEPSVTNVNMSVAGKLETYSNIGLQLSYNHNLSSTNVIRTTVDWTINNAGSIRTFTGKNVNITLNNPGSTTITGILKLSDSANGYYKEFKVTKTVNLVAGYSNPVLTEISGPAKLNQGQSGNYQALPFYPNVPYLKYVWEVNYDEVGATSAPTFSYTFNESGMIHLYCTVTNTNTGNFGTASKVVQVIGLRSKKISNEQFTVLNLSGTLIVTEVENNETFCMVKTIRMVDYQLDELLTGVTALKGKIEMGGNINTGNVLKGIYVLTLKNGDHTETHKVMIK